jgi:hypothetical protein
MSGINFDIPAECIQAGDYVFHPLTCKPTKVVFVKSSKRDNHLEFEFEKEKALSMLTTTLLSIV